jgi:hypothetical protein
VPNVASYELGNFKFGMLCYRLSVVQIKKQREIWRGPGPLLKRAKMTEIEEKCSHLEICEDILEEILPHKY